MAGRSRCGHGKRRKIPDQVQALVKEQSLVTEKLLKAKHCALRRQKQWTETLYLLSFQTRVSCLLVCAAFPLPALLSLSVCLLQQQEIKDFLCIVRGVSGVFFGSGVSTRPFQLVCLEDVCARLLTLNVPALQRWQGCAAASVPGDHSSWFQWCESAPETNVQPCVYWSWLPGMGPFNWSCLEGSSVGVSPTSPGD